MFLWLNIDFASICILIDITLVLCLFDGRNLSRKRSKNVVIFRMPLFLNVRYLPIEANFTRFSRFIGLKIYFTIL